MDAIHPPRKARTIFHQGPLTTTVADWTPIPAEAAQLSDDQLRESALTALSPVVAGGGLLMVAENGVPVGISTATITRVTVEVVPTLDLAAPGMSVGTTS